MDEIALNVSELDVSSTIIVEKQPSDIEEEEKLTRFFSKQCCSKHCFTQFSREELSQHREICAQLSKTELDMAIMGILSVLMHRDPEAGGTHKTLHERKQVRTEFSHHNKSICQHTF